MIFRAAALAILLLLAPESARIVPGHVTLQATASLQLDGFVGELRQALEKKDTAALRAKGEKPDSLAWLGTGGLERQPKWEVSMLRLPVRSHIPRRVADDLIVFHTYHTVQSIGDHIHTLLRTPDGWRVGKEIPEAETLGFRVRDNRIKVRIEPNTATATFENEVKIEATTASVGDLCLLRLSDVLNVESLTLKSASGSDSVAYAAAPGVIAVYAPVTSFTLSMKYAGAYSGMGRDSYINSREACLTSYWWPHIARLPTTLSLNATVPKGWTVIGQGELKGREESADSTTFSFRNDIPVCYFTFDAAPYSLTTREIAGKRVSACLLNPNADRAKSMLDRFAQALPYFEKNFGPFPYTHYELVETSGPFGGALEAYSFATYGQGSFGAVAHELAHTWWGGLVPCQYVRSMWDESFASYSDELMTRMTGSGPKSPALRRAHEGPDFGRRMIQVYQVPAAVAFDTSNGLHGAVGYGKGAQVLAMLEDLLGQETMLKCVRRFLTDHKRGEGAEWHDFERAVNAATGQNLSWFFDQWVRRGGVPVVSLANVRQQAGSVAFDVLQEGAPYRLRIPVAVKLATGKAIQKSVEVHSERDTLRVTIPSKAVSVELDPDGAILMAGRPNSPGNPFLQVVR